VTRLKTSCLWVAILLLVTAVGCKSGRRGPWSFLADSQSDAVVNATTPYSPASVASDLVDRDVLNGGTVTLVSSHTPAPQPFRTLEANEDLHEFVDGAPGVVLLDFYADWCGPCRKQTKVLHDLEEFASGVNAQIIKVNVEEHPELARRYNVSSLPTLLVLKDGVVQQTKIGLTQRDEIENMLR